MIVASAEVRWFGFGEMPIDLLSFFRDEMELSLTERPREDVYLQPTPGWLNVGVKLRDGKLEIKTMSAPGQELSLSGGVRGRLESWAKWSLDPDLGDRVAVFDAAFRNSAPVAAVLKTRHLRKWAFSQAASEADQVTPVKPTERPALGCNVELTEISGNDSIGELSKGWTFGFEAFGSDVNTNSNILSKVVALVLAHLAPSALIALREAESLSYPAWLDGHTRQPNESV